MPLSHTTREFGINDCGIYKMVTDPSGAAPTYGTKIDVVGVKSLETTFDTKTQMLRGDNTLLAADSILDSVKGKLVYAKFNFDVWATMATASATDSGTTPNMKTTYTIALSDSTAQHKIEAQCKQVDFVGGDIHLTIWKTVPGSMMLGFAEEDYREQSYEFTAVPVIGTPSGFPAGSWFTVTANETAVAIA